MKSFAEIYADALRKIAEIAVPPDAKLRDWIGGSDIDARRALRNSNRNGQEAPVPSRGSRPGGED